MNHRGGGIDAVFAAHEAENEEAVFGELMYARQALSFGIIAEV